MLHGDPKLVLSPTSQGILNRFVGCRMPADAVCPHPRPGQLAQRPARDEHLTAGIKDVAREGQVQRGILGMNGGFVCTSYGGAVVIDENDQFREWRHGR